MTFFRIGQYLAAVLAVCAFVALLINGGLHVLFIIVGVFLYFGWKNEADTIKQELEYENESGNQ